MLNTFAGRVLLAGIVAKVVAFLLGLFPDWLPPAHDIVDTLGDICVSGGGLVIGFRLFRSIRHQLLWRVRRKLILSYVFIGVVPALLIICFFLLAGLLMFYNVSAYLMQSRMRTLVDETRYLAQATAFEIESLDAAGDISRVLSRRERASAERYPNVSFAVVPAPVRCSARPAVIGVSAGEWGHMRAPAVIPDWVPCAGFAGLLTLPVRSADGSQQTNLVARAVGRDERTDGSHMVIVDVPLGRALAERLREDSGIALGNVALMARTGDALTPVDVADDAPVRRGILLPSGGVFLAPRPEDTPRGLLYRPLEWVSLLDYTNWATGENGAVAVAIQMSVADLYTRLSASPIERLGAMSFGSILLIVLGVVGGAFLIIQVVALAMGFGLARSITGAVHELFAGTERVRQGDFTYKIPIRSRDQLGELAESFNSMTSSIEDLLQQKAEKERLAQELKIARDIQMSLLPHGALEMPGLRLSGHCEPAREVGGDYYDFLPMGEGRVGVLIADVAGKGTSAALYMAELKGLVLSLSQLQRSPRQLLIDANRIISNHLDDRAFITTTYAVVDTASRTLTYARAGHCPLIYRPGPGSRDRRARLMAPEGLVLGLKIDNGEVFSRVLEEETLPLGSGDVLVLFTDGVTEAMNASDDCFGESRLAAIVEEYGDGEPQALRDQILREVRAFTGPAGSHDDVTMVIVNVA